MRALALLDKSGVPYKRPVDFYAESVKPDSHMAKIKQLMINEKKRIEQYEEFRKRKDEKKYARQVKAERTQEKIRMRKDNIEQVKRLRKNPKGEVSSAAYKRALKGAHSARAKGVNLAAGARPQGSFKGGKGSFKGGSRK